MASSAAAEVLHLRAECARLSRLADPDLYAEHEAAKLSVKSLQAELLTCVRSRDALSGECRKLEATNAARADEHAVASLTARFNFECAASSARIEAAEHRAAAADSDWEAAGRATVSANAACAQNIAHALELLGKAAAISHAHALGAALLEHTRAREAHAAELISAAVHADGKLAGALAASKAVASEELAQVAATLQSKHTAAVAALRAAKEEEMQYANASMEARLAEAMAALAAAEIRDRAAQAIAAAAEDRAKRAESAAAKATAAAGSAAQKASALALQVTAAKVKARRTGAGAAAVADAAAAAVEAVLLMSQSSGTPALMVPSSAAAASPHSGSGDGASSIFSEVVPADAVDSLGAPAAPSPAAEAASEGKAASDTLNDSRVEEGAGTAVAAPPRKRLRKGVKADAAAPATAAAAASAEEPSATATGPSASTTTAAAKPKKPAAKKRKPAVASASEPLAAVPASAAAMDESLPSSSVSAAVHGSNSTGTGGPAEAATELARPPPAKKPRKAPSKPKSVVGEAGAGAEPIIVDTAAASAAVAPSSSSSAPSVSDKPKKPRKRPAAKTNKVAAAAIAVVGSSSSSVAAAIAVEAEMAAAADTGEAILSPLAPHKRPEVKQVLTMPAAASVQPQQQLTAPLAPSSSSTHQQPPQQQISSSAMAPAAAVPAGGMRKLGGPGAMSSLLLPVKPTTAMLNAGGARPPSSLADKLGFRPSFKMIKRD